MVFGKFFFSSYVCFPSDKLNRWNYSTPPWALLNELRTTVHSIGRMLRGELNDKSFSAWCDALPFDRSVGPCTHHQRGKRTREGSTTNYHIKRLKNKLKQSKIHWFIGNNNSYFNYVINSILLHTFPNASGY